MVAYVTAAQFAIALGISVRQLTRRIDSGKVPPPARIEGCGWRKWPIAVVVRVLREGGFTVPAEWGWTEQEAA